MKPWGQSPDHINSGMVHSCLPWTTRDKQKSYFVSEQPILILLGAFPFLLFFFTLTLVLKIIVKSAFSETRETAPRLKVLAAFSEDLHLIPRSHMAATTISNSSPRGANAFFCLLGTLCSPGEQTYVQEHTHTCKIKINLKENKNVFLIDPNLFHTGKERQEGREIKLVKLDKKKSSHPSLPTSSPPRSPPPTPVPPML